MNEQTQKTILIAGGAGFLGSHLCDSLIDDYQIVVVDNLSTGQEKNIAHLKSRPNFTFVRADIVPTLPASVLAHHYGKVINLASPASPPQYQRLALETLTVGSQGTWHLLQLAKRDGARFVHASTSEVYGDPEIHPQTEDYWGHVNCYGPRSMYDEAKRYGEALIYSYRQRHGLSTGIMRIFNTYGPRMDPTDGRVVSNFITQALGGKPLTIYGDGSNTRSFCYVADLVDGIVKMVNSDEEGPLNLGNPVEFSIKQLADLVLKLTGSTARLIFLPLPADDPKQRRPDISRVSERLNWQPTVELEEGLMKTIEYFRAELKEEGQR